MLSTLAQDDRLEFPISVWHRDRPDILIGIPSGTVGVELTEAITQQYAAYCALAEREFPDALLEPAHFHWGGPDRTVVEMRDLLRQDRLTSDGWVGDCPEQEWAHFMLSLIEAKLDKLGADGFEKFDRNWLAVYDNLPLPNIHLGNAIAFLRPLLKKCWRRRLAFDTLFVEHGPVIAEITARGSDHLVPTIFGTEFTRRLGRTNAADGPFISAIHWRKPWLTCRK